MHLLGLYENCQQKIGIVHMRLGVFAVRFGLVRLILKIKSEPNQTNAVWVGSVGAVFFETKLKSLNTTYFQ